jgi:Protein of unknown function (DUF3303)
MRMLMKISLPVEKGNEVFRSGAFPKTMEMILAEQKPEAVYFFSNDGQRGGFLVVNMKDTSEIPAFAEPWFLAFNAHVEIQPVMTAEDLARATPAIEQAVRKYGSRAAQTAA